MFFWQSFSAKKCRDNHLFLVRSCISFHTNLNVCLPKIYFTLYRQRGGTFGSILSRSSSPETILESRKILTETKKKVHKKLQWPQMNYSPIYSLYIFKKTIHHWCETLAFGRALRTGSWQRTCAICAGLLCFKVSSYLNL